MPRRQRKKSATQRKPSLIFTESPTNCSYVNLPSPVRCASHPPTAEAVPIEDLGNVTWVSPQFRGQPVSCRGKGRTRRITRSRINSGKENLHSTLGPRQTLPKGFVPLRLQGEETADISDIQDLSTSIDIITLHSPQVRTDFYQDDLNTSSTQTPPTVQYNTRKMVSHGVVHGDHENGSNGAKYTGHNTDSPDHPTNCIRQNLNWSVLSSTQTRQQHPDLFPKVLFPRKNSQSKDSSVHHPDHDLSNGQRPPVCVEETNVRTSARLREKYHQALGLFRTPIKPAECRKTVKVLVVDTPECDYGLTLKERRLKAIRIRLK